jgi:superfamily I DNA and/or RNA helicase
MATVRSTKNLILIGDPNQLPQVRNGSHPNDNGLSTFEYLIEQQTTLPEDKGIFLDTTFRMHEDVNNFISSYFYDEKLTNHNITNDRHLKHESKEFKSQGYNFYLFLTKEILKLVSRKYRKFQRSSKLYYLTKLINNESERLLTPEDILIVSPYNLQVFELSKKLGENYRVGTVDKFQGQEAPVVVVSLAASNYEEAPRGIDFILNFNRMNVALSRSQCLSIVVGSPSLTHLHYQNLNSIRLTNFHRTLMSSN